MNNTNQLQLAVALGFFDGLHRGHQALLEKVAQHSAESCVFTFDQHPSSLFSENPSLLLSSVEDRTWMLEKYYNIKKIIVAEFSTICNMEWDVFLADYLQKQWNVTHIVAGHDFHFGKGGEGNPQKLVEKCKELQMTCEIVPPVKMDDITVSSTHIRHLLQSGEMTQAVTFLNHPHILSNKVEHGNKIGSSVLGFPTVNLSIPPSVIAPTFGVYACGVWVGEQRYSAVTNVGIRPTVEEEHKSVSVEGFLLDFSGVLYGQRVVIEFYHFIRGEKKFQNFDKLKEQIAQDVETTKQYFLEHPKQIL